MAEQTFEDRLLALEQRVLSDSAGDFLLAVEELRTMLAAGAPGVTAKLVALAIPRLEAAAKTGVLEAFRMGRDEAVKTLHTVVPTVDNTKPKPSLIAKALKIVAPAALTAPLTGLDRSLAEAKVVAVRLVRNGGDIDAALAPIFGAATRAKASVETQINAASNTASRMVGETAKVKMVWAAERDACVYCLALAGEVVTPGEVFPKADAYAPEPKGYDDILEPPRHPNCRCQLQVLVDQSYAEALKREAQRSVLRGFSLASESHAVRVRAAAKLLATDPVAPKSVKAYAAKAVREGKFPRGRDVPAGDPRLKIT